MTKRNSFLGWAAFTPLILIAVFLFLAVALFAVLMLKMENKEAAAIIPFISIFVFMIIWHLATFVLSIVFIVDVVRNPFLDTEKKALWAIIIYCRNFVAMPVYWIVHLRKRGEIPPQAVKKRKKK